MCLLAQFKQILVMLGFQLSPKKEVGTTQVVEFLGITTDAPHQLLGISTKHNQNILAMLSEWNGQTQASKREIASLL